MDRAKELFLKYNGNRFYMDHNGEGNEYYGYHVSMETEKKWAEEFTLSFLESITYGREAVREYSTVTELLNILERDVVWDRCLYYPLKASQLDDVSVLFMLPNSFNLAEKALKKGSFSRQDAVAYIYDLDCYISQVQERADRGTLTRHSDYTMQEFSDSVYVNNYLNRIRKKWSELFR